MLIKLKMGCVIKNTKIKVKSINSFKNETKKNTKKDENEDISDKVFSFSGFTFDNSKDSHSAERQSQILNNGRIEDNELIFL